MIGKKKKKVESKVEAKHFDVIVAPVVTEKSTTLSEMNKYVFKVKPETTKSSVREAVEAIFNVKVLKVNTINVAGKIKRTRGIIGKRSDYKKAIVTLAEGQTLDMTAGV